MGLLDAPAPALSKVGREKLLNRNDAALQGWRAGLANREFAPAVVVCGPGDSITEGQGATAMDRRYVSKLRQRLRARYPVTGITGGRGFIGSDKTGESSFTWPVTATGTVTTDDNYGPKRRAAVMSATGQYRTFTLQGTSVDLVTGRSSGTGILYYKIDGGTATTFNTSTGYTQGATVVGGNLTRVTLGASGAHTLEVGWSSGGSVYLEGVVEYDGDENAGIRVHDAGHYGYTTTQWVNRLGFFYWMLSIKNLNPDLLIIQVGTNDLSNSIPAATTLANWQSMLSTLRGVGCDPSVLMVAMPKRSDAGVTQAAYDAYVAAAYSLAASDAKVAIADLGSKMPAVGLGTPSYSLYADTVHPTDKGHSMMADMILGAIAL